MKNMKKSVYVAFPVGLTILTVLLYGCVSVGVKSAARSAAGDWKLVAAAANGTAVAVPEDLGVTFSAEADGNGGFDVYGFAGVNNYSGSASISGDVFEHSAFAVTLMAGPEADAAFERVFLSILESAEKAAVVPEHGGTVLRLSDADGKNTLTFAALNLADTAWRLSAYNTGSAVSSLPADTETPELVFDGKGGITGFTGVNRLVGTYAANETERTLSFSALGMTKMGAPSQTAASLESRYAELLGIVSRYQLSASSLRLLDDNGTTLLVFVKAI